MSKGSARRPKSITDKQMQKYWDRVFGEVEEPKCKWNKPGNICNHYPLIEFDCIGIDNCRLLKWK